MVSEMHGVWASGGKADDPAQWVQLAEVHGTSIMLSHADYKNPVLKPEQARYLASKLYRMARRLETANA